MRDVARAGDDFQIRKIFANQVGEFQAVFHVVDGIDQQRGFARTGGMQEVQPRGITIENLGDELAQ